MSESKGLTRLLIIGLDGADYNIVRQFMREGDLPNLAGVAQEGVFGKLRSTLPPFTFPAWSSFLTGCNPGKHGIFDFTRRILSTYKVKFVNSHSRCRPSVFKILDQANCRSGVMGIPTTYPPEKIKGFMISGFDAPVTVGVDKSFMQPPQLYREIRDNVGEFVITEFQELRKGNRWHETALNSLLNTAERRRRIAEFLLKKGDYDCFMVLFGETDTAGHHFWAFHDQNSPRHIPADSENIKIALRLVYRAADRAVGNLMALCGENTDLMILSDHGMGGSSDQVIYLNRLLAQWGYLKFAPKKFSSSVIGKAKNIALDILPAHVQEMVFRKGKGKIANWVESAVRFQGIKWNQTRAFSEEMNSLPSIWLHVQGRDPLGIVKQGKQYESLRSELIGKLESWMNPFTGNKVFKHVHKREDIYSGECLKFAPDLILEPELCGNYAYNFQHSSKSPPGHTAPIRKLNTHEFAGCKGETMNGTHRPDGIFFARGPSFKKNYKLTGASIKDITPTILQLLHVNADLKMDGSSLQRALNQKTQRVDGRYFSESPSAEYQENKKTELTEEEEKILKERLENLGYL